MLLIGKTVNYVISSVSFQSGIMNRTLCFSGGTECRYFPSAFFAVFIVIRYNVGELLLQDQSHNNISLCRQKLFFIVFPWTFLTKAVGPNCSIGYMRQMLIFCLRTYHSPPAWNRVHEQAISLQVVKIFLAYLMGSSIWLLRSQEPGNPIFRQMNLVHHIWKHLDDDCLLECSALRLHGRSSCWGRQQASIGLHAFVHADVRTRKISHTFLLVTSDVRLSLLGDPCTSGFLQFVCT
jgi:hypothetical protein